MREALKRVGRELSTARRALEDGDSQELYASLERTQHEAFEARAILSSGPVLP